MLQDRAISFAGCMTTGRQYLNTGKFADGAIAFDHAIINARNIDERARAHQMKGIALRLNGNYELSHIAFGIATMHSLGNDKLRLRIQRDEALTFMEEGRLQVAAALLSNSASCLHKYGDLTESAVSTGLLGRVHLLKGDRRKARLLLAEADGVLRGSATNDDYELNNLIWLVKATKPFERRVLLPRALRLIKQTGQRRRLAEVAILMVGGNWLYNYVEALCRRRSGT